jgi:signal transduction histidine kinase
MVIFLGTLVYLNSPKNIINRSFLSIAVSVALWSVFVLVGFRDQDQLFNLFVQRAAFGAAAFVVFFVLYFCFYFPKENANLKKGYLNPFILGTVIIFIMSAFTPYVLQEVNQTSLNEFKNVYGFGFHLFAAYTVIYVALGAYQIKNKISQLDKNEIYQAKLILSGIIFSVGITVVTNLILPGVTGNNNTLQLGPISLIFFIAFTAYAILRHHLFNMKALLIEALTFCVWLFIFIETLLAEDMEDLLKDGVLFVFVVILGIFLIRTVLSEISQRENVEKLVSDLEIANKKLQQTDAARREFLSFASHQMRTPMTIIKGMASVVSESVKTMSPEKIKMSADKIIEATERLNKFSLNLTDARAIEEGRMQYQFQEVDIVKIISSVIEEFRQIANKKGLILTFESTKSEAMIKADTNKLQQVIQNLIDNALKFTEHGFVKVSIEGSKPDTVSISIIDSGGGMPPETIKNLFQPFMHRFASVSGVKSTGLGLYIAKEIANAHGGNIRAESEGEGKGSRFILEFPIVSKS